MEQGSKADRLYRVCEDKVFHGKVGRQSNLISKILESNIKQNIVKHESELAMRLNCAAHDGDVYMLSRLIGAGAYLNQADYMMEDHLRYLFFTLISSTIKL